MSRKNVATLQTRSRKPEVVKILPQKSPAHAA
jgi:hypothetical protein